MPMIALALNRAQPAFKARVQVLTASNKTALGVSWGDASALKVQAGSANLVVNWLFYSPSYFPVRDVAAHADATPVLSDSEALPEPGHHGF